MKWLSSYLERQKEWSSRTFGPGRRTVAIVKHIKKELKEIEAKPDDLIEWVDVIILGIEGYWRHGGTGESLALDLITKQMTNFTRQFVDRGEDEPSEHVRP